MTKRPDPQSNDGSDNEILSGIECAKRLSIKRTKLYRLRRYERLPYIEMGAGPRPRILYLWSDVQAWLKARSKPKAEPVRKRGRPRNIDRGPDRDGGRGL